MYILNPEVLYHDFKGGHGRDRRDSQADQSGREVDFAAKSPSHDKQRAFKVSLAKFCEPELILAE